MKIAFIGQKGIPARQGGPERHVEELATLLVRHGHRVVAYVRPHYTTRRARTYKGVHLVSLPTIKTKHLDASVHSLLASLHVVLHPVDVINYQAIGPAFFSVIPKLLRPRTKIIVTNHGIDWQRQKWGWFAKLCLLMAEKVSARIADNIVCVSRETAAYYQKMHGVHAVYIPNGVRKLSPASAKSVAPYGLRAGGYLLFMARLVPEKGAHYLIEAFKKITTDKKLVIAGGHSHSERYVRRLHQLADGDERIIFTGEIQGARWRRTLSNAYAVVQPSDIEAASFSILEAISFNRAVLVSDIADNVDLIKRNGYFFERGNSDDLRKKIIYLLDHRDELKAVTRQARNYIFKHYNWETITGQFAELYRNTPCRRPVYELCKRALDIVLAFSALVTTAPLLAIIAICIKLDSPGSILFSQTRIGRNIKPFTIYKFRTMYRERCTDDYSPKDTIIDSRVTRIGAVLRIMCLDELPQLFNVLRGDMSLVGPRPEQWILKNKYSGEALERFYITPGLTGPWQISGKKNEEIYEHLEYDLAYCQLRSFVLDLYVMALTPWAIARNIGVSLRATQHRSRVVQAPVANSK